MMSLMKHPRLLFAVLGLALLSSTAHAQLSTIVVGPRPESITRAWQGKFYVSIQGNGTLGLNDGEVRQVDVDTGVVTPFVSGLDNPRGLAFTGKYLVVADQVRIWIIDEVGNKRVLAEGTAFPYPAVFFNDAAPERGGRAVYVTEMGRRDIIRDPAGFLVPPDSDQAWAVPATSRIYRITLDGRITSVVTPTRKLLVINGVTSAAEGCRHGGKLLALDFFHGNVVSVDPQHDRAEIIATAFRGADGIEQGKDGTIYVSSFENGAVWKMDQDGENLQVLIDHVGRQSTADFYLDEKAKQLLVPDTLHGTVIVLPTE